MTNSIDEVKSFYNVRTRYEITINPCDALQYFSKQNRIILFVTQLQKHLNNALTDNDIQFNIYLELSEPVALNKSDPRKSSSGSRLHYHGTIYFPTALAVGKFLLHSQYLLIRFADVQINPYRPEYWDKYITKQCKIMAEVGLHFKHIPTRLTHKSLIIHRNI